jgi:hypothetical protein
MEEIEDATSARPLLLVCAWCAPLTIVIACTGLFIAGVLPFPLGPDSSPGKVVAFYSGGAHVTLGFVVASLGFALLSPLAAGVSHIIRADATPGSRILSNMQLSAGTYTAVTLTLVMIMMSAIALRPQRNADLTVMMNDLAWLLFIMPVGVFMVQNVSIALYVLRSRTALFPRWFGYLNLWVAFTFTFDVLGMIYTAGPFGWNRPLIFWLALTAFTIFLVVLGFLVRRVALSLPRTGAPGDLDDTIAGIQVRALAEAVPAAVLGSNR